MPPSEPAAARTARVVVGLFVGVPLVATVGAMAVLWGRGISCTDLVILLVSYSVTISGVTVGLHRYFTHGAFKAKRWVRITLAVMGSAAIEGSPITWVADHRRHHAYSDKEGDPHSPWRFGTSVGALTKGFVFAHIGWMFRDERTNKERFAPDLIADADIVRVDRYFPWLVVASLGLPGVVGGLVTWSWTGALTAFLWGGLVRVFLLHHMTWSVNSICHMFGERPFNSRDKAANFWPLAIPSFGESWHNSHHADPTCARHGVLKGQIDISARIIRGAEKLGWVYDVRWPTEERMAARRV
ncbi:MAG: Stearoyl-CoA 9-desaturase [Frankiales bacterium]|nr:Stearoyl-CoA 9-desaturase [Frankiales bacterium]